MISGVRCDKVGGSRSDRNGDITQQKKVNLAIHGALGKIIFFSFSDQQQSVEVFRIDYFYISNFISKMCVFFSFSNGTTIFFRVQFILIIFKRLLVALE